MKGGRRAEGGLDAFIRSNGGGDGTLLAETRGPRWDCPLGIALLLVRLLEEASVEAPLSSYPYGAVAIPPPRLARVDRDDGNAGAAGLVKAPAAAP